MKKIVFFICFIISSSAFANTINSMDCSDSKGNSVHATFTYSATGDTFELRYLPSHALVRGTMNLIDDPKNSFSEYFFIGNDEGKIFRFFVGRGTDEGEVYLSPFWMACKKTS